MAPTPLDRSRDADAQREAQRTTPGSLPADDGTAGKLAHDARQAAERARRITSPTPADGHQGGAA